MSTVARVVGRARRAATAWATAWQDGGAGGLRRMVVEGAYWRFHPRVRRWRAELPRQQAIDDAFDLRFGVDTAGEVQLSDAGMDGDAVKRGHGVYRPVWTEVFHEALRGLPVAFERFTFVDYGSGKGKALLLAAEYPFEEIIGIEFARSLHEVAAANLARYSSPSQRCEALRSMCVDALDFAPPERPLVCFFFNPFDDATLDAVIGRLAKSVERCPREVFLVYANMRDTKEHVRAFRAIRAKWRLEVVAARPRFLTYRLAAA